MKRLLLALAVASAMCAVATGQVRLLIVDETETIEESMRIEVLARRLVATGAFVVRATQTMPTAPWDGGEVDLVLVIPARSRFVWLCAPVGAPVQPPPAELPSLPDVLELAFGGTREVRTPADDLYPLLLSSLFARIGVFGGDDGAMR
ncbi:MAG: hypothetical protein WAW99_05500 [Candidatus Bipolaricaulis anaerobius]